LRCVSRFHALPAGARRAAAPTAPRPLLPPQAPLCAGPRAGPILAYHILHSEVALANALECWLYHCEAAEALAGSGEALLDLLDYCARGTNRLIMAAHGRGGGSAGGGGAAANADPAGAAFAALAGGGAAGDGAGAAASTAAAAAAAAAQLSAWCADACFNIGCSCVTMLRFLAEHAPRLPLALLARMLDYHDLPLTMVPLLENPPWVRRVRREGAAGGGGGGSSPLTWQKYVGRVWRDAPPAELLRLTPLEGQPWLALRSLLLEPDARRRYALTPQRARALQRVRRYLSDALVDQVPPLAALRRCLDEAALAAAAAAAPPPAAAAAARGGALLLEPVVGGLDAVEREARVRAAAALAAAGAARPGDSEDGGWRAVRRLVLRHLFDCDEAAAELAAAAEPAAAAAAPPSRPLLRGGGDDAAGAAPQAAIMAALSPRVSVAALAAIYADDEEDEGAPLGGGITEVVAPLAPAPAASAAAAAAPRCRRCGGSGAAAPLKRCSRCAAVWYCGQACQHADWRQHREGCAAPAVSA